jgi:hypothetical protein
MYFHGWGRDPIPLPPRLVLGLWLLLVCITVVSADAPPAEESSEVECVTTAGSFTIKLIHVRPLENYSLQHTTHSTFSLQRPRNTDSTST